MKNSTLIRIKVPKALYESALRKALLEAEDKEHKGGHKGKKYTKEDDYDKEEKTPKAGKGYADKEPTKTGKAHKGKAFVKDDAYTDKVSTKKSLGETKKKKIKESEDEFGDAYPQPNSPNTGGSRTASLYPNRDVYKDTYRLSEKKKKMEEATDVANLGIIAYGLATFLGVSSVIVKNIFKYMKENNLKGMKGFIKAYDVVGSQAAATINKAKGIDEAKKKKTKGENDDTAEDTKLIKKLVAPSALKASGSKHPDEKADVALMHKKLKPSAFKGSK